MKKIDLIHTSILIVALLAGYEAIQNIISILSILAFLGDGPVFKRVTEQFVFTLIAVGSFTAVCIILVKNGRNYAALMLKDDPEGSWEDAPKWDLDRRNILLALFIGMGLYTLIRSTPYILNDLYVLFSDKVSSNLQDRDRKNTLVIDLLNATIGSILIYAAPALTNFIDKTIAVRLENNDSRS